MTLEVNCIFEFSGPLKFCAGLIDSFERNPEGFILITYLSSTKTVPPENYFGLKIIYCNTHSPVEQKGGNIFISLKQIATFTNKFTNKTPQKIKSSNYINAASYG